MRRVAAGAAALLAAGGLTACESTQDKSARLAKKAKHVSAGQKLVITKANPDVKVGKTTVLKDANGAAVVVVLRNTSAREQAQVPVAIDVKGGHGNSVFRNDAPGLEPSLVTAPLIPPHGELVWVNDQVVTTDQPKAVDAKVGPARLAAVPRQLPRIEVDAATLKRDPVSGVEATGGVTNRSKVVQRKLVLFAVARRGGKVVAAGRGQIKKLLPSRRTSYHIFFIGNPKGAKVTVTAPPSVLK
jgi:hypothetical protein